MRHIGNAMKNHLITRFAVVGLVLLLACVGARADPIYTFTFTSAGYTNSSGDVANLSGTFSWDATTNSIIASDINLSGFDATGSTKGLVSCTDCTTGIYDHAGGRYFAVNLGPQALYITFANSLSLGADAPLALSVYGGSNGAEYQGGNPFSSVTGSASPIPEPVSLTLLGSGLLGLGSIVRRRRNKK